MEVASTKEEQRRSFDWGALIIAIAGLALGAFIALKATNSVLSFHASVFALFAIGAATFLSRKAFSSSPSVEAGFYADNVIKAFTIATVFWGVVGFLVGVVIAWQLAFPALNFDLPWTNFGRLRPLHTSAVIFAFGGNALIATSLLRRAAHLPRAPVRRQARLVRLLGLPALHRARRDRLPARHHPEPRIRRARMVRRHLADDRLGRLSARLPRHDRASARSRTSTWRTGSTSPSSSPSRCCTSSTTWRCRSRFSARRATRSSPACRMR